MGPLPVMRLRGLWTDGGVHQADEPSGMLPRYQLQSRQTGSVPGRYVTPPTSCTAIQGEEPSAVAELLGRLLIVAPHDGVHSAQLL